MRLVSQGVELTNPLPHQARVSARLLVGRGGELVVPALAALGVHYATAPRWGVVSTAAGRFASLAKVRRVGWGVAWAGERDRKEGRRGGSVHGKGGKRSEGWEGRGRREGD